MSRKNVERFGPKREKREEKKCLESQIDEEFWPKRDKRVEKKCLESQIDKEFWPKLYLGLFILADTI